MWSNKKLDNLLPKGWVRLEDVKGSHHPINLICDKGHSVTTRPTYIAMGHGCVKCNARHAVDYGKLFERVVNKLLIDLHIDYKKVYKKKLNPDYVRNNEIWMDAKLSRWTVTQPSCKTIDKYEPNCRMLFIIYLRGEVHDKMITKKTRLISVYNLVKQLPKFKQKSYLDQLEEIKREADNSENRLQSV